jgi:TP53 regulating kinase and related kinases
LLIITLYFRPTRSNEVQKKKKDDSSMISQQGAEGRVFEVEFLGRPAICKQRLKKPYRIQILDEKLNKQRILQESRCIGRCLRSGVPVPM